MVYRFLLFYWHTPKEQMAFYLCCAAMHLLNLTLLVIDKKAPLSRIMISTYQFKQVINITAEADIITHREVILKI